MSSVFGRSGQGGSERKISSPDTQAEKHKSRTGAESDSTSRSPTRLPVESISEAGEPDKRRGGFSLGPSLLDSKFDRRMSDPGNVRKEKQSKAVPHFSKEIPIAPSPLSRSPSSSPTVPSPARSIPTTAPRPRPQSSSPSSSPASSTNSSPVLTTMHPHAPPVPAAVKRSSSDDWTPAPRSATRASRDPTRRLSGEDQPNNKLTPRDEHPRSGSASPSSKSSASVDRGLKIKEIWQNTKNLIGGRLSAELEYTEKRPSRQRSRGASVTSDSEGVALAVSLAAGGVVGLPPLEAIDEGESSGQDSTPSDKSGMEDTIIHHDLLLAPPLLLHNRPGQWRSYDDSAIDKVISDDPNLFFAAPLDPVLLEPEEIPLDLDLSEFDMVYDKPLPPPPPPGPAAAAAAAAAAAMVYESYSRPLPPVPAAAAAAPREGLFASKGYTQTTRKASVRRGMLTEDSHVTHVSRAERRSALLRRTASSDNVLALASAAPDFAAQVQPCTGFRIESPNNSSSGRDTAAMPADMPAEDPEPVYARYFVGKRHVTYIGFNNYIGYVAVSLLKESGGYLALLRTKEADQRVTIPAKGIRKPSDKKLLQLVNAFLSPDSLAKVPSADMELVKMLCDFDDLKVAKLKRTSTFKIGVLYVREGQNNENDMFANTETSREYEDFLNFLGQRVPLQGFTRFNGGLDVEGTSTGHYSVYTQWENAEIMFHVSTLIPLGERGAMENKLIERKRHIGNDVVVVVYSESTTVPFNPRVLGSHYNHVFIVVSADRRAPGPGPVRYRISVVQRDGVPAFQPPLAFPPVYPANLQTRNFLLSKMVNGELAALYAPGFRSRVISSRQKLLQLLASKYAK